MKLRKENGLPSSLVHFAEPTKKRSKLVLPEPQISDLDMQQVIKLGKASEIAREVVLESGIETTDALLGDYSVTPQVTVSSRTPVVTTDRIMQEAQTIMALTHVETPLKGGVNTPLHNTDFSTILPKSHTLATPNTLLVTPFRSTVSSAHTDVAQISDNNKNSKDQFPTPLTRDKLNINNDEFICETPIGMKEYQKQLKESIREKLSSLPLPRNDYEILVPEENTDDLKNSAPAIFVEDQSDVDSRILKEEQLFNKAELARRSQVIQKDLPRPFEINTTILRPLTDMIGLTDLQRAEELIKKEMITMLHYDALVNPVTCKATASNKKTLSAQQLQYHLEQNPYDAFEKKELNRARDLLSDEMTVVKNGMAHGDLSLENYSQVWLECLSQVLYLPSQNRYTRANLASKKDRFEASERRLEINRKHMAKEAKRCGKTEKKMKILTGGYQVRVILLFICMFI